MKIIKSILLLLAAVEAHKLQPHEHNFIGVRFYDDADYDMPINPS